MRLGTVILIFAVWDGDVTGGKKDGERLGADTCQEKEKLC